LGHTHRAPGSAQSITDLGEIHTVPPLKVQYNEHMVAPAGSFVDLLAEALKWIVDRLGLRGLPLS
jgi:hypothetical protein